MSTPWSAEQTQWLQAMGHQVWNLAAADTPAAEATTTIHEAEALLRPMTPERTQRPRQTPAARAPAQAPQDRLLQAVLRAANRTAGDSANRPANDEAYASTSNSTGPTACQPHGDTTSSAGTANLLDLSRGQLTHMQLLS